MEVGCELLEDALDVGREDVLDHADGRGRCGTGRSTWSADTRLTETLPQTGQRTATPIVRPSLAGESRKNDEGNTGRGRSSG